MTGGYLVIMYVVKHGAWHTTGSQENLAPLQGLSVPCQEGGVVH